jgi:polyphosphate glucokinase
MKQRILVIDIGGTTIKIFLGDQKERFPSGPWLTPEKLAEHVLERVSDWEYDFISIGFPGKVVGGKVAQEPWNLADGWMGFDFTERFQRPVRLINDAAMQALGNYDGARMLFVGLGTGVGSTLIVDNVIVSVDAGSLLHPHGRTLDERLRRKTLDRVGRPRWRRDVMTALPMLQNAFATDYLVVGGGNRKYVSKWPEGCRRGADRAAMAGGIRLWHTRLLDTVYIYQPTGEQTERREAASG